MDKPNHVQQHPASYPVGRAPWQYTCTENIAIIQLHALLRDLRALAKNPPPSVAYWIEIMEQNIAYYENNGQLSLVARYQLLKASRFYVDCLNHGIPGTGHWRDFRLFDIQWGSDCKSITFLEFTTDVATPRALLGITWSDMYAGVLFHVAFARVRVGA